MNFDPEALAQDVLQAHARVLRRQLTGGSENAFWSLRHTAQKTTYESLSSLASTRLGKGLRSYVAWLVRARLLQDVEVAIQSEQTRLSLKVLGHQPVVTSHQEARLRTLTITDATERLPWLQAFLVGSAHAELADRHARSEEILNLMGVSKALFLPESATDNVAFAEAFLRGTDGLAAQLHVHDWPSLVDALSGAVALAALPRRVQVRWLSDVLPNLATSRIDPQTGPGFARARLGTPLELAGISSFMRLLYRLGETLDACTEAGVHERIQRADPSRSQGAAWGCLFAGLLTEREFAKRALGASDRESSVLVRLAARAALFDTRLACYALVRAPEAFEPTLFGHELTFEQRRYFRFRKLDADVAVWGLRAALHERRALFDTFDSDWFRNPRTAEYFCAPRSFGAELGAAKEDVVSFFEARLS